MNKGLLKSRGIRRFKGWLTLLRNLCLFILATTLMLSCGMSEKQFKVQIEEDVEEISSLGFENSFTTMQNWTREKNEEPPFLSFAYIMTAAFEGINKSNPEGGLKQIIEIAEEYPRKWQDEAKLILVRSYAIGIVYGQVIPSLGYSINGKRRLKGLNPPNSSNLASFAEDFFLPVVFDTIYASVVPDSIDLQASTVINEEILGGVTTHWMGAYWSENLNDEEYIRKQYQKGQAWFEDHMNDIGYVKGNYRGTTNRFKAAFEKEFDFCLWNEDEIMAFLMAEIALQYDEFADDYSQARQHQAQDFSPIADAIDRVK